MLDIVRTMQTSIIRTVLHSEEAKGLVFHKGPINKGPVFPKIWTWAWFWHVEVTWGICHSEYYSLTLAHACAWKTIIFASAICQ